MKRFATGLFITMVMVYTASKYLEKAHPFFPFLSALTEAAMVGALADWFAVVALFKHPMGIPIPHTAIIQHNKDRFGETLAAFMRHNFLSREALAVKLSAIDFTGWLSRVLSDQDNTKKIALKFVEYGSAICEKIDDRELRGFMGRLASSSINNINILPLIGNLLGIFVENNKHQELLDEMLLSIEKLFHRNKADLEQKIKQETPWWVPDFIDTTIAEKIITKLDVMLGDIRSDPRHEIRIKFNGAVQRFIGRLHEPNAFNGTIAGFRESLLGHPKTKEVLQLFWESMKINLLRDIKNPDSLLGQKLEQVIRVMGNDLASNTAVREKMNSWIYSSVLAITEEYADAIITIISDTVKRWDTEEAGAKIELYIGKDLQWIRINGTLVGGLVGLLIYIVSRLFS
ncbi:MAG: DUF445 domain-containing protein [Pseudomonadota bacterium]